MNELYLSVRVFSLERFFLRTVCLLALIQVVQSKIRNTHLPLFRPDQEPYTVVRVQTISNLPKGKC